MFNLDNVLKSREKIDKEILNDSKVLWSEKSIKCINRIMKYINTTNMTKPLNNMIQHYLIKNSPDNFSNNGTLENACEIYIKKNNTNIVSNEITSNKIIYRTVGKILYEVINDLFTYTDWPLSFDEIYMINLITEILSVENNDLTREIVKSGYFLTKHLITVTEKAPEVLYYMEGLFTKAQSIDIGILEKHTREIKRIMNTKRTLYLRFFLIITNYMLKEKCTVNIYWVRKKTSIKNLSSLKELMSDDIIQLIIAITGITGTHY